MDINIDVKNNKNLCIPPKPSSLNATIFDRPMPLKTF